MSPRARAHQPPRGSGAASHGRRAARATRTDPPAAGTVHGVEPIDEARVSDTARERAFALFFTGVLTYSVDGRRVTFTSEDGATSATVVRS